MAKKDNNNTQYLPQPVVSVVGHVDHGKTTLLDTIRKTKAAAREKGGITQSIGASEAEVTHEEKLRRITFIDTPGHEAFANMRAQGVSASDIVLLVVAADDGIKPQTRESIEKIKEAALPFIVVFTKTDAPGANIEKVKQEVAKENILLEGLGGDVPFIGVSAEKGEKITELLDLIVLVFDYADIEKRKDADFLGVVIDSKIDKRRGMTATIVVKQGILEVKQELYTLEKNIGRVRALVDTTGEQKKQAYPGEAVEVLGITENIAAGSALFATQQEKTVKKEARMAKSKGDFLKMLREETKNKLQVILKTQTAAELEALKNALPEEIEVVSEGQGNINTSDMMRASDVNSIVIGFNVNIENEAKQLANSEKIFYKTYAIIYELLDEIQEVADSVQQEEKEKIMGNAKVLARFGEGKDVILGLQVESGRLALNDKVRLMRNDEEIGTSKIASIKRGKAEVKEVAKDLECGIKLEDPIDFNVGDAIIAYK